jgi:glutamine amidotransferase
MARSIVIIDYGMGNLASVANALRFLGYAPAASSDARRVSEADAIILPGVGAFALAMENLERLGLPGVLREQVLERRKPFLGICLGMQLLAESSTEMGLHRGLGFLRGRVEELRPAGRLPVPHVGWNDVRPVAPSALLDNLPQPTNFYFDHSYHLTCDDAGDVAAVCSYGGDVVAAIQRDNVFATQFHPEKSQTMGLRLLRNFLNFVEAHPC